MDFIIFASVGAGVGLLALIAARVARRGPVTPIVSIATSSGEAEAHLWRQRLARGGIWCKFQDVSLIPTGYLGHRPSQFTLWVHAGDEDAAREALGIE